MRMEMNGMKESLILNEEKLLMTEAKNIQLEQKLKKTFHHIKIFEDELTSTKIQLAADKIDLTVTIDDLTCKGQQLEREVSILKNPPFIHACGYIRDTSTTAQTITYSSLYYSSTNTEGGGLDVTTGIFSCPHPGSYTVTWSLSTGNDAGEKWVEIFLRKNGQNIVESYHRSRYTGPSGAVYEQGGRSLVLHLDIGDSLDLFCSNCEAGIYYAIFCVSLTTFDII